MKLCAAWRVRVQVGLLGWWEGTREREVLRCCGMCGGGGGGE